MNKNQKSEGFSLVELTVAASILAVLSVSVMASFSTAFQADRLANQTRETANSAQAALEVVAGTDFDLIMSMDGTLIEDQNAQSAISVTSISTGLVRVNVASRHVANGDATMDLVTVIARPN